jgi:hypothetical protein
MANQNRYQVRLAAGAFQYFRSILRYFAFKFFRYVFSV